MARARIKPYPKDDPIVALYERCRALAREVLQAAVAIRKARALHRKTTRDAEKLVEKKPNTFSTPGFPKQKGAGQILLFSRPPEQGPPPPFTFDQERSRRLAENLLVDPADDALCWRTLGLIVEVCADQVATPRDDEAVTLRLLFGVQSLRRAKRLSALEVVELRVAAGRRRLSDDEAREKERQKIKAIRPTSDVIAMLTRPENAQYEIVARRMGDLRLGPPGPPGYLTF